MRSISENSALLKRISELEAELAEAERKQAEAERKQAEAERKQAEAESDRDAFRQTIFSAVAMCKGIFSSGRKLMCGDPREDIETAKLTQTLISEVLRISQEAQHLDHHRRVGNEGLHRSNSETVSDKDHEEEANSTADVSQSPQDLLKEQVEEPLANAVDELKNSINDVEKTLKAAANAAAKLAKDGDDPAMKAANAIMRLSAPTRSRKVNRPSPGRKAAKVAGNKISKSALVEHGTCPECHEPVAMAGSLLRELKTTIGSLDERCTLLEQSLQIGYCEKCNCAVSSLGADTSVPITPENGSTNSQDLVLEAMAMQVNGIPRNRAAEIFFAPFNMGHNTICEMESRWLEIYGHLIVDQIKALAKEQDVLIFDETPYRCLDLEGRGVAKTRTKTEDANALPKSESKTASKTEKEPTAKQAYVFCVSTRSDSPIRLAIYEALRGRSASAIQAKAKQYLDGGKLKVFATDGFESYDCILRQLAEEKPNLKRSACWTHWRRVVLKALELPSYSREVGKMSIEQAEQHFIDRFGMGTSLKGRERLKPQELFLFIIEAIRSMYAYEANCMRLEGEDDESFYKRVNDNREKKLKPLVEEIDGVVKELMKGRVKQRRDGTWIATPICNKREAAAVTYYLNNRDALWLILDEPRAPLDTNAVERAIRPMACLEGNSGFRQSFKQMQILCDYFTLFETARLCGIERPEKWLIHFGRMAFKHCFEKQFTEYYRKNGIQKTSSGFRNWDMEKLIQDFDITPFLPWNYQPE